MVTLKKGNEMLKGTIAILLLAGAGTAMGQSPKINNVHIEQTETAGRGCPAGTTETIVTPQHAGSKNADYFQLVFDEFEVRRGPDDSRSKSKATCTILMNVTYPKGYRFRFEHSSFDGYAEINEGQTAEFKTTFARPGGKSKRNKTSIRGPFEGDFSVDETRQATRGFWSGCEGSTLLRVQSSLRLKGSRDEDAVVTRDVQSGSLIQGYRVRWQRCD